MAAKPISPLSNSLIKKKVSILPAISERTGEAIYFIGNILLVVTAVAAALGTVGVFWGDRVRDYYNDVRLSDNEKETQLAKTQAALANEGAAKANERAVGLEKEAANSRLELEQIKEKQQPRTFTLQERTLIVGVLNKYPPVKMAVAYPYTDDEAQSYAKQLITLIEEAKYPCVAQPVTLIGDGPGLHFYANDPNNCPLVCGELQQTLSDIHVEATWTGNSGVLAGEVKITVGSKPLK